MGLFGRKPTTITILGGPGGDRIVTIPADVNNITLTMDTIGFKKQEEPQATPKRSASDELQKAVLDAIKKVKVTINEACTVDELERAVKMLAELDSMNASRLQYVPVKMR